MRDDRVNVRLTEGELATITRFSQALNLSRPAVVRLAIQRLAQSEQNPSGPRIESVLEKVEAVGISTKRSFRLLVKMLNGKPTHDELLNSVWGEGGGNGVQ